MQQSIPVNAAPMRKEATEMATAISAGTPTITTCAEWRLAWDSFSVFSIDDEPEAAAGWVMASSWPLSYSTGRRRSATKMGPRRLSCCAAEPTCQSFFWHLLLGSSHYKIGNGWELFDKLHHWCATTYRSEVTSSQLFHWRAESHDAKKVELTHFAMLVRHVEGKSGVGA